MTGPSEADPRVAAYVAERGISEILHFTTSRGLIGILASDAVLSRDLLEEDQYLEFVYTPNCTTRLKDAEWTGYVNLSISRVNNRMLGSSKGWHALDDLWWVVLAFDPYVAADADVVFTTTNNTYPNVSRASGVAGIEAMFADGVPWGYYGKTARRYRSTPDWYTTEVQAEVLYPGKIGLDRLTAVYVHEPEHIDEVKGLLKALRPTTVVPVQHRPEVFQ